MKRIISIIALIIPVIWLSAQSLYNNGANIVISSGTYINVPGNCTNASGSVIDINGILNVSGTLTNGAGTSGLVLNSDASGTAQLITSSTGVSATVKRYLTGAAWHMVSSPMSGQTIANFLTNNSNISTNGGSRAMMNHIETSNSWSSFYTNSTTGDIIPGKAYAIRLDADGTVNFTGTLNGGNQTVSSLVADKWNLVGNTYTATMGVNSTGSTTHFLGSNASNLNSSYQSIYIWDPAVSTSNYQIQNLLSGSYDKIQSCQGFFVKMNTSATSLSFSNAMKSASSTLAMRAPALSSWSKVKLTATSGVKTSTATIAFNEDMTKGLDPGYDAGLLKGTSGLDIYTKLVEDNEVNFAIQALPQEYSTLVIPVGVDMTSAGSVEFSVQTDNLAADCDLILEDRLNNSYTDLAQTTYTAQVDAQSTTGRFYIHTSTSITTDQNNNAADRNNITIYPVQGTLIIQGMVSKGSRADLYSSNGDLLYSVDLNEGNINSMKVILVKGLYLMKITDGSHIMTRKLLM